MLLLAKDFQKEVKDGTADVGSLANHLMRHYSVYELATSLAEMIIAEQENAPTKITISQAEYEQLMSIFRIRGIKDTGEKETRGRRPKIKEGD